MPGQDGDRADAPADPPPAAVPPAAPAGSRSPLREPLWWLLAVVAVGMVLVLGRAVRPGVALVALDLGVAAGLRATLSPRSAGLLVVRSRAADVTVLALLAIGLAGLLAAVPFRSRG